MPTLSLGTHSPCHLSALFPLTKPAKNSRGGQNRKFGHGVHGGHGGHGVQNVHVHHVGRNIRGDYFWTKILWSWCQGLVEWQDTNLVPLTGIGPQAGESVGVQISAVST